ncbi:MAG TPA: hypothetical protein DCZ10_15720 [Pelotomaculum sp.]|nr:hypothetical protein [Pelotomaculum sp.]
MNKREIYKPFEFEGRKWRIGKFDAMTGSYIAYKLMAEMLPMGLNAAVGIPAPGSPEAQNLSLAPAQTAVMSKADFFELQRDCLSVVAEMLPAGPAPVLLENGQFGVDDLEHDARTVLALTIQVLSWNVSSFFDAALLGSLADSISNIFRPNAKM